jgi:DNA-binding response OmpR family regulator
MDNKVMKRARILVVEDESDLNLLFHLTLEREGFEVDTYEDPLSALSHFTPNSYDLVILDIKMPKMNGFELYDRIKKIDDKVKICFLTASEMYYEEYRKSIHFTFDKNLFLRKPIENKDLIKEINRMLQLNQ